MCVYIVLIVLGVCTVLIVLGVYIVLIVLDVYTVLQGRLKTHGGPYASWLWRPPTLPYF